MAHMVGTGQRRKNPAVVKDAANRNAPETDTVIAALPPDKPGARALSDGALIGERDLHRGIDRFRTRSGEENTIKPGGRDLGQTFSETERQRMGHLKAGRKIKRKQLFAHGIGDFATAVPGVDAPQPGGTVQHGATVIARVIHALGRNQHPGRCLELAVRREWHPIFVHRRRVGEFHPYFPLRPNASISLDRPVAARCDAPWPVSIATMFLSSCSAIRRQRLLPFNSLCGKSGDYP